MEELQKHHMPLDNHCLKWNLSGLHVLPLSMWSIFCDNFA